jgi:hypothetical protein
MLERDKNPCNIKTRWVVPMSLCYLRIRQENMRKLTRRVVTTQSFERNNSVTILPYKPAPIHIYIRWCEYSYLFRIKPTLHSFIFSTAVIYSATTSNTSDTIKYKGIDILIIIIIIYLTANVLSPGGSGYNERT